PAGTTTRLRTSSRPGAPCTFAVWAIASRSAAGAVGALVARPPPARLASAAATRARLTRVAASCVFDLIAATGSQGTRRKRAGRRSPLVNVNRAEQIANEEAGMDVGIGLPNAVPGTSGAELTEFARRADARGFSSLGTIDRVVYGNYEPLIALAAA